MPITKSAKKSLKVSETKRKQNKAQEIELEKALQKVSASNINEVISKIDKAAKTGIIAKNKAARLKSKLTKKFGTAKKATSNKPKVKTVTGKSKTKTPKKATKK